MNDFCALGITNAFAEKLSARAITQPTAVQRMVIGPLLEGHSVIFRSATGTGKTLAYLLPALQRVLDGLDLQPPRSGPALVVCAPTLELCSQIKREAELVLGEQHGVALLTGSADLGRQIDALKKGRPLVAVGNPGRLLLLAKMGKLTFHGLRFLVLDEADRLCAKECLEEMRELAQIIVGKPGGQELRLTVAACSATVSAKTREALHPLLDGALLLETDDHEVLRERIEHWAIFSEGRRKTQTLASFFAAAHPKKALVFTGRSYDAGKLVAALHQRRIAAEGLYSGMGKTERKTAIDRFRSGKAAVLVSSDLAARGLDIPAITHVIALETSDNKDTYIHRAGRTGRAGKRGIMVTIGDELEMHRLAALEKKLGIVVYPKELYNGKVCKPEAGE